MLERAVLSLDGLVGLLGLHRVVVFALDALCVVRRVIDQLLRLVDAFGIRIALFSVERNANGDARFPADAVAVDLARVCVDLKRFAV